jgi:histidinol-phosphate aminotransferase
LSLRPRHEIEGINACPHGGPDYAELESMSIAPDKIMDFSVCSNPYPLPGVLGKRLGNIAISQYPDSEATLFREALARRLSITPANILAGSGTTELIRLIALAYFGHGDSVLVLKPTYGEYEVACQITGAEAIEQKASAKDNFCFSPDKIGGFIRHHQPKGIFICNPNNPTGQYLSRQDIDVILQSCPESLLVLDEAYVAFVEMAWSSVDLIGKGNVIVLRSMTKDYALAGLRLGYAMANEDIINTLRRICPPWNVNVVAQEAGLIALRSDRFLEQCLKKLSKSKKYLIDELRRTGLKSLPSQTNYFLVKVGDGREFRQALLRHGILVRDCASFGLPEYVRIAPRTMPECRQLISAIQLLKREGESNV